MQIPQSIYRALLDTHHVRDALIHTDPTGANIAVLICDQCPTANQIKSFERILHKATFWGDGWSIVYLPRLPIDSDGQIDTQALTTLSRGAQHGLTSIENTFAALSEVNGCAAILRPYNHQHAYIHPGKATLTRQSTDTAKPAERTRPSHSETTPQPAQPSLAKGSPLPSLSLETMDIALQLEQAVHTSPARFILISPNGDEEVMTTTDVWVKAGNIAGFLHSHKNGTQFVLLFTDNVLEAVAGFWACLRLGKTAAILTPPRGDALEQHDKGLSKLRNIWKMLDCPPVAATEQWLPDLEREFGLESNFFSIQSLLASNVQPPPRSPLQNADDLAVITFTSGSTGLPKAVPTTFRNLCSMHVATNATHKLQLSDASFNWLPIDHLGPLNWFSLMPALRGSDQVHTTSEAITKSPLKLLDYLDRWRCTHTWAPNFAFNLINAQDEALQQGIRENRWDLSHVRILINAGESVTYQINETFCRNLAPCKLRPEAITPSFGMAESVTGVCYRQGIHVNQPVTPGITGSYIDLGYPCPGIQIRITDDQNTLLPQGEIGQLQLHGDQIINGYYRNPEANADSFTPDGWFKTGDLAFMRDDHMYVTGRAKEIIIINGMNYVCHELEAAAESVSGVAATKVAAVAFRPPDAATEALALFFHPNGLEPSPEAHWPEEDGERLADIIRKIKQTVAARMAVTPALCLPVGIDDIPRTGTGKIQRLRLGNDLMAGGYDSLSQAVSSLLQDKSTLPPWFHEVAWHPCNLRPDLACNPQGNWLFLHTGHPTVLKAASMLQEQGANLTAIHVTSDACDIRAILETTRPDHIVDASALGDGRQMPFRLFQSLAQHAKDGNTLPSIQILSQNSIAVHPEDTIIPEKAGISALVAILAKETGCQARLVDCNDDMTAIDMMRELTQQRSDSDIAWRKGQRLALRLTPVSFPPQQTLPPLQTAQRCLVTGGLGGVGTLLIKHLIDCHQAHITILGRTSPARSPHVEEQLRTLRHYASLQGAEVQYTAVDVTDPKALTAMLDDVKQAGPIRIFHLAGTKRSALLHQETEQEVTAQWQTKAGAVAIFIEWLRKSRDRSLCVFSTSNSLFPTMGTTAYATANRAMDEIIHAAHLQTLPVQSLAWSTWVGTGMGATALGEELLKANGLYALEPDRALLSYQAVANRAGRMVVGLDPHRPPACRSLSLPPRPLLMPVIFCQSTTLPSALLRQVRQHGDVSIPKVMHTVVLDELPKTNDGTIDYTALSSDGQNGQKQSRHPASELEKLLLSNLRQLLETPDATVDDNFFSLGGQSLTAARFLRNIKQQLGVDLALNIVFRHPTAALLAAQISQHAPSPEKLEAIAAIHLQLASMSPEEQLAKLQELRSKRT